MPTTRFKELDSTKKSRIIAAGIAEFAASGYTSSSTNRIAKEAGISKGSLFQYFPAKEELYFFILESVLSEYTASLEAGLSQLPKDLFQRVAAYAELEFAWYLQNPDKYKIIIAAFTKSDSDICRKVEARYRPAGEALYHSVLAGVDAAQFGQEKQKTIDILRWFLNGFKEDFIAGLAPGGDDLAALQEEYMRRLAGYMEILKNGFV